MPPKRKKAEDDSSADDAELTKTKVKAKAKAKAEEAADGAESASAGPVTSAAKAKAKGAESIQRSETPRAAPKPGMLTLIHWNVGGMNGLLNNEERKARLTELVETEKPDLLAFSEHKLSEEKREACEATLLKLLPGYTAHWAVCTAKKGYSGVAILVKEGTAVLSTEVDQVEATLHEGRTLTVELEHCIAVAAYVPNSGQKLERLDYRIQSWDPALRAYLQQLEARKPVVLFGDLNVCHLDADIWNVEAKHIPKSAGCTPQERESFSTLLEGFDDCFRSLHAEATGTFSYWSTRAGNQALNRGLRLDYAVASRALTSGSGALRLHSCDMLWDGSGDHCPLLVAFAPTA